MYTFVIPMVEKDSGTWDNGNDAGNRESSRQVWNQGIAYASHVPLYNSSRFFIFSLNLSFEL